MRFSIWPNLNQPWGDLLAQVHHAEATGWDGVYVADHFSVAGGRFVAVDRPTFHAPPDLLPTERTAALAKDYQQDRATVYVAFEIRGALSVTRPL